MLRNTRRMIMALALAAVVLALLVPASLLAQEQPEPVVYAILLWSPSCPHCHDFIDNDWPRMHEEFGDQFVLLFINVMSEGGNQLAQAAYEAYRIRPNERYVPMMMIGDDVLVGAVEIPERGSQIIREALASGEGIPLPPVPGLQEAYDAALAAEQGQSAEQESAPAEAPAAAPAAEEESLVPPDTLGGRLAHDPLANTLAIGVLLGLVASLGVIGVAGVRGLSAPDTRPWAWMIARPRWVVAFITALAGLGLTLTLLARAGSDALATLLAGFTALMMVVAVVVLFSRRVADRSRGQQIAIPGWLTLVVALAGLATAVYLAYVEVGQEQAFCGAVGDCNTVQQSPYATLFGVLPVGVLGVIGYLAILVAWSFTQLAGGKTADVAHAGLLILALIATAFSAYLTFLEPFVIGATCAWCLTSAVATLLLLWLVAAEGWRALRRLAGR